MLDRPLEAICDTKCFAGGPCRGGSRVSRLVCGVWVSSCGGWDCRLCCGVRLLSRPGREKFSVTRSVGGTGSVCVLDKLKASPAGVTGVDIGESSPSVSAPLPTRLENGTRSPFRRLPRLYVVRVDLRSEFPGAAGRIGMSLSCTPSPPAFPCSVSRLSLCITVAESLTSSSRS